MVYVATENDSVYAFDADGTPTRPLWRRDFTNSVQGITAVPCADIPACPVGPVAGITGTPVIGSASKTLYVVAFTKENGSYFQRLHALDITTGAEKFGGPVVIQASVQGTGAGSVGGTIAFESPDPKSAARLAAGARGGLHRLGVVRGPRQLSRLGSGLRRLNTPASSDL